MIVAYDYTLGRMENPFLLGYHQWYTDEVPLNALGNPTFATGLIPHLDYPAFKDVNNILIDVPELLKPIYTPNDPGQYYARPVTLSVYSTKERIGSPATHSFPEVTGETDVFLTFCEKGFYISLNQSVVFSLGDITAERYTISTTTYNYKQGFAIVWQDGKGTSQVYTCAKNSANIMQWEVIDNANKTGTDPFFIPYHYQIPHGNAPLAMPIVDIPPWPHDLPMSVNVPGQYITFRDTDLLREFLASEVTENYVVR